MAETPIGVTDAGGQFACKEKMQSAFTAVEDLFKSLMIW